MDAKNNVIDSLALKVTEHLTAMVAYWDKDQICRFANSSYSQWFGKTKDEIVDKMSTMDLLGSSYENNRPYIEGALNGVEQTFERVITLPSGIRRHTLAHYYPDIVDGIVVGFVAHAVDVDDSKNLELALKKSTRIVFEQNKRLLNFSNIISHNLKSYSNNLALILELFSSSKSEKEKNETFGFLKKISKQFSSTMKHLNDIVDSQNKSLIKSESINIHNYIEQSIESLQVQISSIEAIVINSVGREVKILANPVYMESIILNFLTNAIKYRREDVVSIITFACVVEDGRLALIINDNGKGIDLKKHGKDLFGMYKTFHGNSDAQGIGLYITKYQVETMGGDIKVVSNVGIGTTFTIYFNL